MYSSTKRPPTTQCADASPDQRPVRSNSAKGPTEGVPRCSIETDGWLGKSSPQSQRCAMSLLPRPRYCSALSVVRCGGDDRWYHVAYGARRCRALSCDLGGSIALRTYGDRIRAMDIARLNNIENPDLIFPGQVLMLPQVERRCRRTQYQETSYVVGAGASFERARPLDRRLFSPPSERQPDQRRMRVTASDRSPD